MFDNSTAVAMSARARILGWAGTELLVYARQMCRRPLKALDHMTQPEADILVMELGNEIARSRNASAKTAQMAAPVIPEARA